MLEIDKVIEDLTVSTIEEQDELELVVRECDKHAFSDGKYFEIDIERSSFRGNIFATCKLCPSNKVIKGSFKSSTNFSTHIKVRFILRSFNNLKKLQHQSIKSYIQCKLINLSLYLVSMPLQRIHADHYQAYLDYKQSMKEVPKTRDREQEITCRFSQRTFETNVTNYVIESMAPLSIVEMPSFRKIFDGKSHVKMFFFYCQSPYSYILFNCITL